MRFTEQRTFTEPGTNTDIVITILCGDYQRNGISGAGFCVFEATSTDLFPSAAAAKRRAARDPRYDPREVHTAVHTSIVRIVVFREPKHVAVFGGNLEDHFRGDTFENAVRQYLKEEGFEW